MSVCASGPDLSMKADGPEAARSRSAFRAMVISARQMSKATVRSQREPLRCMRSSGVTGAVAHVDAVLTGLVNFGLFGAVMLVRYAIHE